MKFQVCSTNTFRVMRDTISGRTDRQWDRRTGGRTKANLYATPSLRDGGIKTILTLGTLIAVTTTKAEKIHIYHPQNSRLVTPLTQ